MNGTMPLSGQSCTLALADSSALFRLGVRNMAKGVEHVTVVGEASNGLDLLELAQSFPLDLVVVDFLSEGFDIDVVRRLKLQSPATKVLAITTEQRGHTIVNALKAGVDSYIKKDCDLGEVEEAIRETANGGAFFCGKILDEIRRESIDVSDLDVLPISCDPILLSGREMEVLQLIAEGFTNTQMADKLFLSAHTVTTHRKNIMAKLGVNNTAALVMYAVKTGAVSPNKFLFQGERV
jgi:DNA-binding NarL/FixJ family response regulator